MWKSLSASCWLLVLAGAGACDPPPAQVVTKPGVSLSSLSPLAAERSDALGWPRVLLPLQDGQLLWGEDRNVYTFEISEAGLTPTEEQAPELGALDRLSSGAEDGNDTVVLLDWAGRVLAIDRRTGETRHFETLLRNVISDVALADGVAYLLLHGGEVGDPAVIGYRLTGEPIGRWGSMPPDGLIQGNLRGGGITACADGSIFYSYVNSPRIQRLRRDETRALAGEAPHFHRLSAGAIRRADRDARESTTVASIVELGLTGSRVMALHCTRDGLLLRQVARPDRAGAYVEVWDPAAESLVGMVAPVEGLLVGAVDRTLLFATGSQREGFRLARKMLPSFTGENVMEKKLLWFFMVGLLLFNLALLWQRQDLDRRLDTLARDSVEARLEKAYVDEQETLVLGAGLDGSSLSPILRAASSGSGLQFLLLASLDDCTNCIEDEVERLNQLVRCASRRIDGVRGVLLDEDRREQAEVLLSHLSPSPAFPLSIEPLSRRELVGATTPLVLVVSSDDGKIVDAHKPIPQDLSKRDTFYTRWFEILAECGGAA